VEYLIVIGLIGMPGSGKGECARMAEDFSIPVFHMGDLVRDLTRKRKLELTDEHVGSIAHSEREKFGYGIWAKRTLAKIEGLTLQPNEIIVIDGIRGESEISVFHDAFGEDFKTVAVKIPEEKRFQLLQQRKRSDAPISQKEFSVREEREVKWGIKKALEEADYIIFNTGTLPELKASFMALLEKIKARSV